MSTIKKNLDISPQDLFTSSTTQGTDLGQMGSTGDGRYFRYVLAGATTLVPGKLQQAAAQDATNLNPSGGLAVSAAATGATTVTLTGSLTLTANQLAGAIMTVAITPGQGYQYKVKGNTAVTSAANCVVTLEDPILVSLTTSSKVIFAPNPYNSVVVNPATASSNPVGVAVYPIVNAQYGWIQTHGQCGLLSDGGTAVGLGVAPSASVAGAAKTATGIAAPTIGQAMGTLTDTQYGPVFLTID